MSNLKPSLRPQERQVDVIEINLRAKEKIVGDRSMPNLARARALPLWRSENSSGELFGDGVEPLGP